MSLDGGLHFIDISARAYQYIRQFSIKSVEDALIELITNSIDAYKKTSYTPKKIDIEIVNPNKIIVRDYALGLDASQLEQCFLSVGNFTATDSSRGFFSRGAKDISAIGNVYFTGIKNNSIAQCFLNTDAYGQIILSDTPITPEYRLEFKIPEPFNGLEVEIILLPTHQNIDVLKLASSVAKIAVLRDIFSDTNNIVTMTELSNNGNIISQNRLTYNYPIANNILFLEYDVPGYTQYKAKFVVNQTAIPVNQPTKESQLEFGFLIKDNTSVYEVNTLDTRFRWNPYMNYIYGYVFSNGIHDLLLDYDRNGPSIKNPFPVIDPSRITGVNTQHPFIIALYSIPLVRLDYILRQLNVSKSSTSISIDELNDLMNELNALGEQIIKDNSVSVNWQNNYDSSLVHAINDDRMKYVNYEKVYEQAGNFTTEEYITNNQILEQIINIQKENNNYPNKEDLFIYDSEKQDNPDKPATPPVIKLENIDATQFNNDPVKALELIPSSANNILNVHPYIYQLTDNGTLNKIYIFSKGIIDYNSSGSNMKLQNKNFTIIFINDLNLSDRYLIDTSQGIQIKINLNNNIVKKYLSPNLDINTNTNTNQTSISNFQSIRALLFLKELLIDAVSNVILGSDVLNKKLVLDADSYNNTRKLVDYKSKVVTQVEMFLDNIFDKYMANSTNINFQTIAEIISKIGILVSEKMEISEDLSNLRNNLLTTVQEVLTK
jgi:hypothetical protein